VAAGRTPGVLKGARGVKAVLMYTTAVCPFCQRAERLLMARGVFQIEKIRVDLAPHERDAMVTKTGRRTVPQIFIGETHVGGFDDLAALDRAGELMRLLASSN
jgi:glutaredoxin 3